MAQTNFCVHRCRFYNKLNSAKFSKSFIDRLIRRCVTEWVRLKRIITRGVYQVIQRLCIAYPAVCRLRMTTHVQNLL